MNASASWHLAQINVARLVAPRGDARVAPFFAAVDRVNARAEAAEGFLWRLVEDARTPDPLLLVNLSLWRDVDALFDFVYHSAHAPVMARRREWFAPQAGASQALWWVPVGTAPTVEEGFGRLWLLDRYGPSPQAFTFKARFAAPTEGSRCDAPATDSRQIRHG